MIDLTAREVAILDVLLARAHKIVSKQALFDAVFPTETEAAPNALEVHVSRLRQKLRCAGVTIRSVREKEHVARQTELSDQYLEMNIGLAAAMVVLLDSKDEYTAQHSAAVAMYCRDMANVLQLPEEEAEALHLAGLLHDLGKVGVPDAVLRKANTLDEGEWEAGSAATVGFPGKSVEGDLERTFAFRARRMRDDLSLHARWTERPRLVELRVDDLHCFLLQSPASSGTWLPSPCGWRWR